MSIVDFQAIPGDEFSLKLSSELVFFEYLPLSLLSIVASSLEQAGEWAHNLHQESKQSPVAQSEDEQKQDSPLFNTNHINMNTDAIPIL